MNEKRSQCQTHVCAPEFPKESASPTGPKKTQNEGCATNEGNDVNAAVSLLSASSIFPDTSVNKVGEVGNNEPKPQKKGGHGRKKQMKGTGNENCGNSDGVNKDKANDNESDSDEKTEGTTKKPGTKIKRREDIILKSEGVTRRKVVEIGTGLTQAPNPAFPQMMQTASSASTTEIANLSAREEKCQNDMRVRLRVRRYVGTKSAPLCRGTKNKKRFFMKGDVVDVLCPETIDKNGMAIMVVHKAKTFMEHMKPRCFADYEEYLSSKGDIECDFSVVKRGLLKKPDMTECYYVRIIGDECLWIDKSMVKELPPGATPVQHPPDIILPIVLPFKEIDPTDSSLVGGDMDQVVLSQQQRQLLMERVGGNEFCGGMQKDAAAMNRAVFNGSNVGEVDKDVVETSLPLFRDHLLRSHHHHHHQRDLNYGYSRNSAGSQGIMGALTTSTILASHSMGGHSLLPSSSSSSIPSMLAMNAGLTSSINSREDNGIFSSHSSLSSLYSSSKIIENDDYLSLPLSTQCREQLRNIEPNKK